MNLLNLLIAWLVTAVSLVIISKLPLGVEIDNFKKALISGAVLGILNVLVRPLLGAFLAIPNVLTLGLLSALFAFIMNVIIFGLAAYLVQGFRLRWGFWSAILGSLGLTLVSNLITRVLPI